MPGLHAGHDVERREAREVLGVQAFDMDDLVAGVPGAVDGAGLLDGVQYGADATVAGGVHEALEATGVERGEQVRELLGRVEGVAPVVGAPCVGLEHGGGARLHHVVDVELERSQPQPVVGVFARRRREVVEVRAGGATRVEEGGDDPRTQPPLGAGALEQGQVVEGVLRFDDGGDTEADGVVERGGEALVLAVRGGPGHPEGVQGAVSVAREPLDREVGEEAGRFAGRGVRPRGAERQVRLGRGDTEQPQGGGVEPDGVDVVAEDERGGVPGGRVEIAGGGHPAVRDGGVVEGFGLDPRGVGIRCAPAEDAGVDLLQ